jgi:hypothetical protein
VRVGGRGRGACRAATHTRVPCRVWVRSRSGSLTYDEFIRLLAELSALTAQFRRWVTVDGEEGGRGHGHARAVRRYDTTGGGHATLAFAQFLDIVFSTKS